jgi:hypothetical protein
LGSLVQSNTVIAPHYLCKGGSPVSALSSSSTVFLNSSTLILGGVTYYHGSGTPSGNCNVGDEYNNTSAGNASTVKYLCYPANTWNAVKIP